MGLRAAVAVGAASALLIALLRRRRPKAPRRLTWQSWSKELNEPLVLLAAPLGACRARWTLEYLLEVLGDRKVSAHVSKEPGLDYVSKNFAYEVMSFRDFIARVREKGEWLYYRSQHAKRNKAASLECLAPLDADFELPFHLQDFEVHSTVLRAASPGLRMWLHFDICDNLLVCVKGRKRVLLLPPSLAKDCYLQGSSSLLGGRLMSGDLAGFPLARRAYRRRWEVLLEEGESLLIPALWLHCTEALGSAASEVCVSLNVFFLRPENTALHDPKDVWANRELLPAQEATKAWEEKVLPSLAKLPKAHRAFWCRKVLKDLTSMAEEGEEMEGR